MVSDIHGIDVTLPLLSSPPPKEAEEGDEEGASEVPRSEEGGGGESPPARPPSAGASTKQSPPVQEPAKGAAANVVVEDQELCDGASTGTSDKSVWEEREVPASGEPFFFAVPPLPKAVGFRNVTCHHKSELGSHKQACYWVFVFRWRERGVERWRTRRL